MLGHAPKLDFGYLCKILQLNENYITTILSIEI